MASCTAVQVLREESIVPWAERLSPGLRYIWEYASLSLGNMLPIAYEHNENYGTTCEVFKWSNWYNLILE
jgi:hypothetical protein